MRTRPIALLAAFFLAVAGSTAAGQVVSGMVVDTATSEPLVAVAIMLIDAEDETNRVSVLTDSAGRYQIRALRPGLYRLSARRVGYEPLTAPPRRLGEGQARTLNLYLTKLSITLDAVVSRAARQRWGMTPARNYFAEHLRAGKGFFTSGAEILISKMNACAYLGAVPGLAIGRYQNVNLESGIPCTDGRILMTQHRPTCMNAYVDRFFRATSIDSTGLYVLDTRSEVRFEGDSASRRVPLTEVMGIEVFRNYQERPKDFSVPTSGLQTVTNRSVTAQQAAMYQGTTVRPTLYAHSDVIQNCTTVLIWTRKTW